MLSFNERREMLLRCFPQQILSTKRTRKIWRDMLRRCLDEKDQNFKDYGGRGITVCQRWRDSFENFLEDMGEPPTPKRTLDRKNNNGNYEPGNCRWATMKQQARNKRNTVYLKAYGKTWKLVKLAEMAGISYSTAFQRYRAGWCFERILFKPVSLSRRVRMC